MTNNEKFNAMLNACHSPADVVKVLLALAESGFFDRKEAEA